MEVPLIEQGVQTWKLDSWREYYDFVATYFENKPAYIFRGQTEAKWPIKASLDRLEDRHPTRPNFSGCIPREFDCPLAPRDVHLRAFRQAVRGRPGVPPAPDDDDECWAFAQHHGLATPMLDWTLSPFVALFFAFEDDDDVKQRAVFAVSSSVITDKHRKADAVPMPFLPRNEASYRLLAQAGLFLRMPEKSELEGYVRSHFADDSGKENGPARPVLIKCLIANQDRAGCLKMLNKMNINRMTLFPDADGAARYVNSLWDIDFDTSLGYIGDRPDGTNA